jgi:ABC-type multidrug transport system fused ATPase/permease subunit
VRLGSITLGLPNLTSFKSQLDDQPISELNIQDYRKNMALVSQEPVRHFLGIGFFVSLMINFKTLYAGTVRFNILLGAIKPHSEVTQTEIEDACRSANILDFINDLPKFVHGLSGSALPTDYYTAEVSRQRLAAKVHSFLVARNVCDLLFQYNIANVISCRTHRHCSSTNTESESSLVR